ncbi:uncharacterized protein C21orf140 homolog [Rhinoraja longicauda]
MRILTKLFLHSKAYSSAISSPGKYQCLQYLKTLRNFENDGFYTVYLGETHISENLITGDVNSSVVKGKSPLEELTLIHAGGVRGWVPWQYRVFFQSQQLSMSPTPVDANERIFEEFCQVLSKTYGKCTVVMRSKHWVPAIRSQLQSSSEDQSVIPLRKAEAMHNIHLQSPDIRMTKVFSPRIARHHGHEFLYLPPPFPHLSPLESAWSSIKWSLINNRKHFTVVAFPKINDYKCIHLKALIENAIERVTPCQWKTSFNRVKKWENRYLYNQPQ